MLNLAQEHWDGRINLVWNQGDVFIDVEALYRFTSQGMEFRWANGAPYVEDEFGRMRYVFHFRELGPHSKKRVIKAFMGKK